jgi:integrase
LNDSRDIRLVAQALGHSDVRITMRYTERGNEEVAEALEKVRKNERSSR